MNTIPKDPYMLLSFINTKLRDQYPSLQRLCDDLDLSIEEISIALSVIDYKYNKEENQFR